MNRKPINQALEAEANFFSTHPNYNGISTRLGIPFLSKTLNSVLINHIKKCVPSLKSKIATIIHSREKEHESYGTDMFAGASNDVRGALILNLLAKFSAAYSDMIEGRFVRESAVEYMGGSRISHIFTDIFGRTITTIDPFEKLTDSDIMTAIRNANGLRPSLFVPEGAFEVLVR
jgi:dynamin 1-like protein